MYTLKQLTQQAMQAKYDGRFDQALRLYQQALVHFPKSASVEHNLASLYGDMKQFELAKAHAEQALQKGSNAPQTWLVHARALQGVQDYEQASNSYRKAVQLDPTGYDAQRELAQLTWMQTGDLGATMASIDSVLTKQDVPALWLLKSYIYEYSGDLNSAQRILLRAVQRWPEAAPLIGPLIYTSMRLGDVSRSVEMAEVMLKLSAGDVNSCIAASYAYAAFGDGHLALKYAQQALQAEPYNQQALACEANALRMLYLTEGQQAHLDAYRALYDYDSLVTKVPVEAPAGWSSRDDYFADLAAELKVMHPFKTHPFGQSVRSGSQLPNILSFNNPVVNAFKDAVDGPVRGYLEALSRDDSHPLRRRHAHNWKIDGIWSVWLRPGGFHENHVHPAGWLSSACYIELPDCVDDADSKAGWLRLGQPMLPTKPELGAERWVKPEVGHIVIFPSYMWHGTNTFPGEQPRLSIAMDITPG